MELSSPLSGRRTRKAIEVLALLALVVGTFVARPPASSGAIDPIPGFVAAVSSTNIYASTDAITTFGPRTTSNNQRYIDDSCTWGSTEYPVSNYQAAVDWVIGAFQAIGYAPGDIHQGITTEDNGSYGPNVIVTKPGSVYANSYIELSAHLDSVSVAPGAVDDAAGVAAVIEIARVLKDHPSRYGLRFAVFANEESGFTGSRNHVAGIVARGETVKADLNLDGIAWAKADGTAYNTVWTNGGESDHIASLLDSVRAAYGIDIGFDQGNGTASDHSSYWAAGFPATDSLGAWVTNHPGWHQCSDSIDNINLNTTVRATQQNLAAALLLDTDSAPPGPPKVVVALDPSTIQANGTETSVATVTVTDQSGNPLSGEPVTISTNGDVSIGAVTDEHDGTYQATITASTTPGNEVITAAGGTLSATATLHESYACPSLCVTDTSVADFSTAPASGAYVAQADDGEVVLPPTVGDEFSTELASPSGVPAGWTADAYVGTPDVSVSGGSIRLSAAQVHRGSYPAGQVVELRATFQSGNPYQAAGFNNQAAFRFAMFGMDAGGNHLMTYTNAATSQLPDTLLGSPHVFRIEWTTSAERFFVDGALVHEDSVALVDGSGNPVSAAVNLQDWGSSDGPLVVDWVHLLPYSSPATFTSRLLDAGNAASWQSATWTADEPAGTSVTMQVRTGSSPDTGDGTWTPFTPVTNAGAFDLGGRYAQYQATLATSDTSVTPTLRDVTLAYALGTDTTPPTITGRSPAPDATGVDPTASVHIGFSEAIDQSTLGASSVHLHRAGGADIAAAITYDPATTTLTIDPTATLSGSTTYAVVVAATVADVAGNLLGSDDSWSFTTAALTITATDTTAADFGAGTLDANAAISQIGDPAHAGDGEVVLRPAAAEELNGTSMPSGWTIAQYPSGGTYSFTGSALRIDGMNVNGPAGTTMEFSATFSSGSVAQAVGFMSGGSYALFAMDVGAYGGTHLQTNTNGSGLDIPNGSSYLGGTHRFRIEQRAAAVYYFIDGVEIRNVGRTAPAQPVRFQDYGAGGGAPLSVDWVHVMPYTSPATFTSRVIDGGPGASWDSMSWTTEQPAGTAVSMGIRTGDALPLAGAFTPVVTSGAAITTSGRYAQYQAQLSSTDVLQTPLLRDVTLNGSVETNTAPVVDSVTIDQSEPRTNETLTTHVTSHDGEGDPLTFGYQWFNGAVPIDGATGSSLDLSVPGNGDRADAISVQVVAHDGLLDSTPTASSPVVIANTPPVIDLIVLDQTSPDTDATINVIVWAHDPDTDQTLSFAYSWTLDGVTIPDATTATLDLAQPGHGDGGDVVRAYVDVGDGVALASAISDPVTVGNTAPVIDTVTIDHATAQTDDLLTATATGHDDDGDPVGFTYQWLADGVPITTGPTLDLSIAGHGDHGDTITVQATANDGHVDSTPMASAPLTIADTAPVIDSVAIDQSAPLTNDTLTVSVTSHDADGDALAYGYQWAVGGVALPGATSATLDLSIAGNGDVGDAISVEVTAGDGELLSPPASASPVTVADTAPVVDSVTIDQSAPLTNDTLTVSVTSHDVDGDAVTYGYQWLRNGTTTATGSTLDLSVTGNGDHGDTISVRVVADDGHLGSVPVSSSGVAVGDTPPVATGDGYAATAGQALSVSAPGVLANDFDVDGDAVQAALVQEPAHASSFTLHADGSFGYTAAASFTGADSFTYTARAGSASSSPATVTIQVAAPPPTWVAQYYANDSLRGSPAFVVSEPVTSPNQLDHSWGTGGPAGLGTDRFSARYTTTIAVDSTGDLVFAATSDDSIRIAVDGATVLDDWSPHSTRTVTKVVHLGSGQHTVVVEYSERTGTAIAQVRWTPVPAGSWAAEYFGNETLKDPPVVVTTEAFGTVNQLDHSWGSGGPGVVGPDQFSARYTTTTNLTASGRYLFSATSDDGIRVIVDGTTVINDWKPHGTRTWTTTLNLRAGVHTVVVEYYDHTGTAVAQVSWRLQ